MSTEIINNCGCCAPPCCPSEIYRKVYNCYYGTYQDVNLLGSGFPNKIDCEILKEELPDTYTYQWWLSINESTGQRIIKGFIDEDGNLLDFPESVNVYCRYGATLTLSCVVSNSINYYSKKTTVNCGMTTIALPYNPILYISGYAFSINGIRIEGSNLGFSANLSIYEIKNMINTSPSSALDLQRDGKKIGSVSASFYLGNLTAYITYVYISSLTSNNEKYPISRYFVTFEGASVVDPQLSTICEIFVDYPPPMQLSIGSELDSSIYYRIILDQNNNFVASAYIKYIIPQGYQYPVPTIDTYAELPYASINTFLQPFFVSSQFTYPNLNLLVSSLRIVAFGESGRQFPISFGPGVDITPNPSAIIPSSVFDQPSSKDKIYYISFVTDPMNSNVSPIINLELRTTKIQVIYDYQLYNPS